MKAYHARVNVSESGAVGKAIRAAQAAKRMMQFHIKAMICAVLIGALGAWLNEELAVAFGFGLFCASGLMWVKWRYMNFKPAERMVNEWVEENVIPLVERSEKVGPVQKKSDDAVISVREVRDGEG